MLDYTGVGAARFSEPSTMAWREPIAVEADTILKLRLRVAKISGADPVVTAGLVCYDEALNTTGQKLDIASTVSSTSWIDLEEDFSDWPEGTVQVIMVFQHHTPNSTVEVDEFSYEDVTALDAARAAVLSASSASTSATEAGQEAQAAASERVLAETARSGAESAEGRAAQSATDAEGSASSASSYASDAAQSATNAGQSANAASGSASTADTRATEAEQHASAAQQSRTEAQTARTQAQTAQTNAVTAQEGAEEASAAAVSARDTAVAVSSQGTGVLVDQFLASGWSDWNLGPGRVDNEIYPTGKTLTWNVNTQDAGVQLTSDYAVWTGAVNAAGYRIDIEFELVSGSISGAGVLFDWADGSNSNRVTLPLTDMLNGDAARHGEVTLASYVVRRPDSVNLNTFDYQRMYLMANYTHFGAKSTKHLKIHRVQIYPITSTEAAVQEHSSAIADLEGHASAMYALRVKAGTETAQLELIAADNPDGATSLARISADDIILEGSVAIDHLDAEVLNADNINAGTMSVAHLEVDEVLAIDAKSAGFAMGKSSPYQSADGIYMGRTDDGAGGTGFGFAMSRVDPATNYKQSITGTSEKGLEIKNANFFRDLEPLVVPGDITSSQTYEIDPSALSITLQIVGAGGGGGKGGYNDHTDGGNTVVTLKDGSTTIKTWSAAGGQGAATSRPTGRRGASGVSSPWGQGGYGGTYRCVTTEGKGGSTDCGTTPGQGGQGYGSGGGGGGANSGDGRGGSGGGAGQYLEIIDYDVSGLSDPKIVVSIGSGGTGGSNAGRSSPGGHGAKGRVMCTTTVGALPYAADVVPLEPQATGTMLSQGPFPDLGAGYWILARDRSGKIDTGDVEINSSGEKMIIRDNTHVSFVSSKTPVVKSCYYDNSIIHYQFFKMGT